MGGLKPPLLPYFSAPVNAVRKKEYISENLQSPVEVDMFLNSGMVMEQLVDGEKAEESSLKRYKRNKE